MPRYIDADALSSKLEAIAKRYAEKGLIEVSKEYIWACTLVDAAPTADVEKVVYCEDCKYCEIGENEVGAWCDCSLFNIGGVADFYCKYGERRNDG